MLQITSELKEMRDEASRSMPTSRSGRSAIHAILNQWFKTTGKSSDTPPHKPPHKPTPRVRRPVRALPPWTAACRPLSACRLPLSSAASPRSRTRSCCCRRQHWRRSCSTWWTATARRRRSRRRCLPPGHTPWPARTPSRCSTRCVRSLSPARDVAARGPTRRRAHSRGPQAHWLLF